MSAPTKHTPGPWKYRIATGTADTEIRGEGAAVCVIPYRYGSVESRAANRYLILAAPDLLAALQAAVPFVRDIAESDAGDDDSHPHAEDARKVLKAARAALAKAEGGAS